MWLDRAGLPRGGSEYRFWPGRKWQIDFVWWFCWLDTREEVKLALEVEGGIYSTPDKDSKKGEGHRSKWNFTKDMEKYNHEALDGWTLIRVTPEQLELRNEVAIDLIRAVLTRG